MQSRTWQQQCVFTTIAGKKRCRSSRFDRCTNDPRTATHARRNARDQMFYNRVKFVNLALNDACPSIFGDGPSYECEVPHCYIGDNASTIIVIDVHGGSITTCVIVFCLTNSPCWLRDLRGLGCAKANVSPRFRPLHDA